MALTYAQFGIYLLGMLGIGWYSMSKTSDNAGYIVGGRSLGPATTAISAGASDMSGWLLLGLPGAVFVGGLSEGLWISTECNRGQTTFYKFGGLCWSKTNRYLNVVCPLRYPWSVP